jgi:UDP-N-acetyl-D-mannosaminuronic acid transferase (WecB/TagA/CpsF family)
MYDRLIYSEREIKAEEIVAALKKAYPNIGIGGLEDGYFCLKQSIIMAMFTLRNMRRTG